MVRNRILAALPEEERERMLARMTPVEMELRRVIVEHNQPIQDIYFVEQGVISMLTLIESGGAVETAIVGYEGMVGLPVFLSAESMTGQAFVQVSGSALRMSVPAFREELARGGMLPQLLGRYTQGIYTMVAQSSACNRVHSAEQRCARWLLHTHDRVEGDSFDLTHLFLSQMLGVRRATVTEIAGDLQRRGMIDYGRGRIIVTDRAALEATTCPCYQVIVAEFDRLLDGGTVPSPLDELSASEDGVSTAGPGAPEDVEARHAEVWQPAQSEGVSS